MFEGLFIFCVGSFIIVAYVSAFAYDYFEERRRKKSIK
jgi:hypothetical protein